MMRSGSPSRRVLCALALTVVLASCTATGDVGTGPTSATGNDDVTLEGFDDAEESSTTSTTTTAPALTFEIEPDDDGDWTYEKLGEETDTPDAVDPEELPWDECPKIVDDPRMFAGTSGEPTTDWLDMESGFLAMANWDDYRADDVGKVALLVVDDRTDDGPIATAWAAAGFDGASHLWEEGVETPLDIVVSGFGDHGDAIAATRAHLLELCTNAYSTLPLDDWSGVKMFTEDEQAIIVFVAGRYEVFMVVDRPVKYPSVFTDLQIWRAEMLAMIDAAG